MASQQLAPPHRFTFEDVVAMVHAGILDEEDRLELIDGVLVEMSAPGPRHSDVLEWLNNHFVKATRDELRVRVQDTFRIPDGGFFLPDLIVFAPIPRGRHPDTALLIIEVADTSRARDLEKAATYAAARVAEYWVVDVDRDELLVHSEPAGGAYATMRRLGVGDVAVPLIDAVPVNVAQLLAR